VEPSVAWRYGDTGEVLLRETSFGQKAEKTLVCWPDRKIEQIHLFAGDIPADRYLLTGLLRYVRTGMIERGVATNPNILMLTGRPRILEVIEPFLEEAATDAGFRSTIPVPEHFCLHRAASIRRSGPAQPHIILDVGHEGSRLYVCAGGEHRSELAATGPCGGAEMLRAIRNGTEAHANLHVGPRTAETILAQLSADGESPITVKGKHLSSDRPAERSFPRPVLIDALRPAHETIHALCRSALENLPADQRESVRMVLAGGAATPPLVRFLERSLTLPVKRPANPADQSAHALAALQ
jgi:actin-like ATPase involved in cell morphogenesis